MFYSPASQFEFKRAGIYDDVVERALVPNGVAFRDLEGRKLFGMPGAGQLALLQSELTSIVSRHLAKEKDAVVLWSHTVTGLGQDESGAWVDVETPDGKQQLRAQYIVGCDGGSSAVRRGLFGKDAMPGFTWDQQLVASDVGFLFSDETSMNLCELTVARSDTTSGPLYLMLSTVICSFIRRTPSLLSAPAREIRTIGGSSTGIWSV